MSAPSFESHKRAWSHSILKSTKIRNMFNAFSSPKTAYPAYLPWQIWFFLIINILFFQYIISYFGRSRFDQNSIEWLRPHEICQRTNSSLRPKMIVGEADRFDINQGEVYYLTMIILSLIIIHFLFPKWNINKILFASFQARSEIAGFWLQSPIWLNTKNVSIALCPVTKTLTATMLEYFVSDFGGMYVDLVIYWNNTLNNNACY